MSSPRVSVVMSVFNGERYLNEAVDSVLAQSFRDFELLVVDDGSTDSSADIIRRYTDPRIRLITNESNRGLSASLNRGIEEARGEFVARQDADDRSSPERLAHQVAFMDQHPEVALVGTWYTEINDTGTTIGRRRPPTSTEDLRWALCLYSPFVHSAVMWRRQLVSDTIGTYDERLRYSMDYDLWHRIAARYTVAIIPELLVELRMHGSSMTSTLGHASREGLRMRAANAARMLARADRPVSENEKAFEQMFAVTFGESPEWTARSASVAAHNVELLHTAFVKENAIDHRIAERQRKDLRQRIASQAWKNVRHVATRSRAETIRLLMWAFRYEPVVTLRAVSAFATRKLTARGTR